MSRWRWRGSVALLAVCLAFVIYPLLPNDDVINSDWPAFATGAQMIVTNPTQMYDLHAQERYQAHVTGGRHLVTPGINGILPFLAPAWVAFLAVPFDFFGTELVCRLLLEKKKEVCTIAKASVIKNYLIRVCQSVRYTHR